MLITDTPEPCSKIDVRINPKLMLKKSRKLKAGLVASHIWYGVGLAWLQIFSACEVLSLSIDPSLKLLDSDAGGTVRFGLGAVGSS